MRIRGTMVGLLVVVQAWGVASAPGAPPDAGKIDPKAEQYLKAMSAYLGGLKAFTFQAEEFFDDVQDDGQKIQLSNHRKVTVKRPGKVFGEAEGDTADSRFYFDGKTVTVFDRTQKTYATVNVTGNTDAMLDELHNKYDATQPLADFLFADPYKVLMEHVQNGSYLGLHHVGKVKCHHLAFRQRLLDWQIWIEAGEHPLPRKLLITFKRQADEPQYIALFHEWDVNPAKVTDDLFSFQPPEGVRKVDFLHRHAKAEPAIKPAGN